jgi:hypothetical protein
MIETKAGNGYLEQMTESMRNCRKLYDIRRLVSTICLHLWRYLWICVYYSRASWRYHLLFDCTCHIGWDGGDGEIMMFTPYQFRSYLRGEDDSVSHV